MVRVDDGGTGGDIIVIANVPLGHIDQVVIAEATRGISHASQTKIGAIGQHRRQQGSFVGGRIAGAQMHELIREPGPGIDLAQNFGDPHSRQHAVQPQRQIAGYLG